MAPCCTCMFSCVRCGYPPVALVLLPTAKHVYISPIQAYSPVMDRSTRLFRFVR
ncbi:unnamed protein product, partial [Nesidiocoris tenuis]